MLDAAIKQVDALGTLGLGVLSALALFGSYFNIWMWTRQHNEAKAEWKLQLDESKATAAKWEAACMKALGTAEIVTGIRGPR